MASAWLINARVMPTVDTNGKPTLLVFISYNCSTSWRYEKRVGKVMQEFGPKGLRVMFVRSSANDTVEQTKKYAEARNFTGPLLYDEKNALADYFGVRVTPTFVLLDGKGVLRYSGSFDDHPDETAAKKTFARDAITAVIDGKPVAVKETRAFG